MCSSSDHPTAVSLAPSIFAIPETAAPYLTLSVRASAAPDTRVHVQVIDNQGRERIFGGLYLTTVAGMVSGQELSTITVTATAIALRALSDAACPVLSCIRIVLDTDETLWINIFARDMRSITTLERLELTRGTTTTAWSSTLIMYALTSCISAGRSFRKWRSWGSCLKHSALPWRRCSYSRWSLIRIGVSRRASDSGLRGLLLSGTEEVTVNNRQICTFVSGSQCLKQTFTKCMLRVSL